MRWGRPCGICTRARHWRTFTQTCCASSRWISNTHQKRDFSTEAVWYAQLLKTVLGLGLALVVKEGLKLPLDMLFGGHMIARAIRYMVLVIFAGILWPMTFPWLRKLERRNEA